jgi:hypothetical protein
MTKASSPIYNGANLLIARYPNGMSKLANISKGKTYTHVDSMSTYYPKHIE